MLLTACGEYLTELFLDIWSVARFTFWPVGELPPHDRVRATAATLLSVSEPLAPLLPVELEDMIVEGLRNDLQALRTCSLVCKDWNSTARRYLFRTLRVSGAKSETLPLLLLSAPDSIRMNVQTLVFSGAGLDMDYFVSLRGLMQLIASLPKLRDVEIYEPPPFRMDPGVTIDTPHRQSLRRLKLVASCCQTSKFLSLMNIIGLFSSIDKVDLTEVEDDFEDLVQERLPSPERLVQEGSIASAGPVEIHALDIELEPRWLPILCATLRSVGALSSSASSIALTASYDVVANSHALSIDDENDVRDLLTGYGSFIRQLGPSLRGLDLYFLHPIAFAHLFFPVHWDILGLSACTNLEHLMLDLGAATQYFNADAEDMMLAVWSTYLELLCFAHFPKLRQLTLSIAVGDKENDPVFSLDWERLEDALRRFPELQTVLLDVFFLISDHSLQPLSSRLRGLGKKLKFKTCGMAPGHGLGDDRKGEDRGIRDGSTSVVDEASASGIASAEN